MIEWRPASTCRFHVIARASGAGVRSCFAVASPTYRPSRSGLCDPQRDDSGPRISPCPEPTPARSRNRIAPSNTGWRPLPLAKCYSAACGAARSWRFRSRAPRRCGAAARVPENPFRGSRGFRSCRPVVGRAGDNPQSRGFVCGPHNCTAFPAGFVLDAVIRGVLSTRSAWVIGFGSFVAWVRAGPEVRASPQHVFSVN
jgi:hypothetical protein